MLIDTRYKLREATPRDVQKLANLIHFEAFVHRHLDYRPPLDWVGEQPFLLLEQQNNLIAALACPADPPAVAWIRLFAAASRAQLEKAWSLCWPEAARQLRRDKDVHWAAAIPLQPWFEALLKQSRFDHTHSIVMLAWEAQGLPNGSLPNLTIRSLATEDLSTAFDIDRAAFPLLWQNSLPYLELAFRQAAVATLAILDGQAIGYQISTATPMGGHLARLAVLPEYQGHNIGMALLKDLLAQFIQRGARTVTVNTQSDNLASLALYQKMGFIRTGEEYPIYQATP